MLEKYKAVLEEVEEQIVIKKSKFICNLIQVNSEEDALEYILSIRKRYYDANHHCFAYIVGADNNVIERYNDDKEPSGTAGKPILEVLKGSGIKNVIAVVTRYFGGIHLGTGGLIRAYTDSTKAAVNEASLYENILCERIHLEIDYAYMPKVENLLHKNKQTIYDTKFSEKVNMIIFVEKSLSEYIIKELIEINHGKCIIESQGFCYIAFIKGRLVVNNLT